MIEKSTNQFRIENRKVTYAMPDFTEMPIRTLDWCRIRREIESIPIKSDSLLTIFGVLIGIGCTSLFSMLALSQGASSVQGWVWIIHIAVTLFAFITAYVVWQFAKKLEARGSIGQQQVLDDMDDLFSACFPKK